MKVNLSQVLKTKIDIDNVANLSRLSHITQRNKLASLPSFVPEPCKGCSQWRGSVCHDVNGDPCRHVVDWLNRDFPSKQV